MEPYKRRPDMEEFLRMCDGLIQYLSDEECAEIACMMFVVRQKTIRPYAEDVDDVSASRAFAQLPSLD